MKINNKTKNYCIGIDIDHKNIRAVELLRNKNNFELVAFAEILSNNSANNSVDIAITELFNNPKYGKFKKGHINVSIPQSLSTNKKIKIVKNKFRRNNSKINTLIKTNDNLLHHEYYKIHFSENDIGKEESVFNILGLDNNLYRNISEKISPYSSKRVNMIDSIDSINNIYIKSELKNIAVIVDIGRFETNLFITNAVIPMIKIINIGYQIFIDKIVEELKLTEKESIELLSNLGLSDTDLGKKIHDVTEKVADDLIIQIQNYIDDVSEIIEINNNELKKIILSGEMAGMPGFIEYLSKKINHEVEQINPWLGTPPYPLKPMPKKIQPAYAKAISLALYELRQS